MQHVALVKERNTAALAWTTTPSTTAPVIHHGCDSRQTEMMQRMQLH